MTLQILTVRQFLEIFGVFGIYCVMTLFLPSILLYRKICHLRFSVRFMLCQTAGNFYIIYLVMLLQFLHISSRLALTAFTVLPFAVYFVLYIYKRISGKDTGRQEKSSGSFLADCADRVWRSLPEIVLVFVVAAVVIAAYDGSAASNYTYKMSDITGYNRWIYNMGNGEAADRIQPVWFCSIVYYFHTVFRFGEFTLFRALWIIQVLLVHFMLLAFLRQCCRLKYTAYAGTGIYMLAVLSGHGIYAGNASLQLQESGMMFILSSAAFLLLFFKIKKQELDEENAADRNMPGSAGDGYDNGNEDERRVFLLDEVLAETAAKQAAYQMQADCGAAPEEEAPEEVVLIMEENASDGTISIKECPLDGTISIKDTSIDEIAEHASDNIPLLDSELYKKGAGSSGHVRRGLDSTRYLVFFVLSSGMALSVPAGQAVTAALFCAAVCAGYSFRLFKKQYIWRVLLAVALSALIPAVTVCLAFFGGMLPDGFHGMPHIRGNARLTWNAVYSWLSGGGSNWQNLAILLSVALLFLLALVYFIFRQADYAACMLSVAVYMGCMAVLDFACSPGRLEPAGAWECIRLYYAYSAVIVWGLCVDGVPQGIAGSRNAKK